MFERDKDLIRNFHINSGHSASSIKSYRSVFNRYCGFHNMILSNLLKEAIDEQESCVPENQLSIYGRILSFRNYMADRYIANTIINSVSKIKTFYHYNRVYPPFIPPLNLKSVRKNDVISFEDLPTKYEWRLALEFADDNLKLWIYVI